MNYSSYDINKFDIEFENHLFSCRIFWARVISSEAESLLTQYTRHSFFEIQYALQGHIGMIIGDNIPLHFEQSDFVIIPPGTYHQISDSDSVGARFIMAFSLQIKDSCNERFKKQLLDALSKPSPNHESPHMRDLLSIILQKDYYNDPLRRESITSLVKCFLLEVLETVCPMPDCRPSFQFGSSYAENIVCEVEALLHELHGIGISVSDLAQHCNLTERHLRRLFSTVRGYSVKEAIHLERIKRIEELILSTNLSFSEIAKLCGYSDEYAMSKFFQRMNKITPTEFKSLEKRRN